MKPPELFRFLAYVLFWRERQPRREPPRVKAAEAIKLLRDSVSSQRPPRRENVRPELIRMFRLRMGEVRRLYLDEES